MGVIDTIKIIAPEPGACKICAALHNPDQPHERDSLYYQMRFFQVYNRFPSWDDAMAHCSKAVQLQVKQDLIERGIISEEVKTDGSG